MTKVTHEEITEIVGQLDDARITQIIATGASAAEVTEAFGWLARNGEMGEELRHSLTGKVARVYEILKRDEPPGPERD
jgi:hypothetical protein